MASLLALARERLKIIADGYPTLSGKCAVLSGLDAAELECWKRYGPGEFYFLAVAESSLSYGGIDAPTAIHAYLYAQISGGDGEALDDLASELRALWINPANYPGGELACAETTIE